ncbi:MAG: phosphoribosylanthranilate isomerase [Gemmatimonadota bacterium]
MRIKICGVTSREAAEAAARSGVDSVGFVFAESPRRITPAEAFRIAADLPASVERVAVFRLPRPEEVARVLESFDADRVQCEAGTEILAASFAPRVLPVLHDGDTLERDAAELPAGRLVLLEAAGRGGRGVRPDWARASRLASARPTILAGGLDPANVAEAIRTVRPWGVDVSSGVESAPGVKSPSLIAAFVDAVRSVAPEATRPGPSTGFLEEEIRT